MYKCICVYKYISLPNAHACCMCGVCVCLHWIVRLCVLCVHLLVRASVCVFVCVFLCFSGYPFIYMYECMRMTFAIAQSKAYNFYRMCIYVLTCSMRMHAVCVYVYLHWIVSLCVLCVHLLVRA